MIGEVTEIGREGIYHVQMISAVFGCRGLERKVGVFQEAPISVKQDKQ